MFVVCCWFVVCSQSVLDGFQQQQGLRSVLFPGLVQQPFAEVCRANALFGTSPSLMLYTYTVAVVRRHGRPLEVEKGSRQTDLRVTPKVEVSSGGSVVWGVFQKSHHSGHALLTCTHAHPHLAQPAVLSNPAFMWKLRSATVPSGGLLTSLHSLYVRSVWEARNQRGRRGSTRAPAQSPRARHQVCLSLWQERWLEHVLVSSGTRVLFLALHGGSQLCPSRSRGSDALF